MRGCLLIHGLTATPAILAPLRESLISRGYKVSSPLLHGHGGSTEELNKSTWQDWYGTVHLAYTELRRNVEKVYFAGISLGALLGLKLAIDEGWGVRAMALLSTPIKFTFGTRVKLGVVRYSPLGKLILSVPKDWSRAVDDPDAREVYKQLSLPRLPLQAAYQIADLQRLLRPQLHRVSNPLLLLHGGKDPTTPPFNAEVIKNSVSSDVVETEFYDRSKHILTLDWDREVVVSRIVDFFERFA